MDTLAIIRFEAVKIDAEIRVGASVSKININEVSVKGQS